ncbi:HNH endonuclease signature motif containing protein [Spiroplasma floricola]|uniref:HNH domain-containing protein n=1 Tax=Spiroplasma floricola 23-6 TaxID=1336749 RepID=A0A2K8SE47_9MOLU|nr:HNH endonuclease signature motif containing protein [Spiroplasma floricola]AUB31734.1 hypothetical protein SFLOR_v1c06860 [Spiroplasma floricola 23-6]
MSANVVIDKYYKEFIKDKSEFWTSSKITSNLSLISNIFSTNFRVLESIKHNIDTIKTLQNIKVKDWPKQRSGQDKHKQSIKKWKEYNLTKKENDFEIITKNSIFYENELLKIEQNSNFKDFDSKIYTLYFMMANNEKLFVKILKKIQVFKNNLSVEEFQIFNKKISNLFYEVYTKKNNSKVRSLEFMLWNFSNFSDLTSEIMRNFNYLETEDLLKINEILDQKLKSGGVYTIKTFKDELFIYNFIINFLENLNLEETVKTLYSIFKKNDYKYIINFLERDSFLNEYNESVIELFSDFTSIVNFIDYKNINNQELVIMPIEKAEIKYVKISRKDRTEFNKMKSIARNYYNNKCYFENNNNCKYFISETTNENYIEIHHLIPHGYSEDFKNSIEVIENYVALCPNCHKKIHYSTKKDKYKMISILYNERHSQLALRGLKIELEDLSILY